MFCCKVVRMFFGVMSVTYYWCVVLYFIHRYVCYGISVPINHVHWESDQNAINFGENVNIRHHRQHVFRDIRKQGNNVENKELSAEKFFTDKLMDDFEVTKSTYDPQQILTSKSFDTRSVNKSDETTRPDIPDFVAELPDTMDIVTKFLKFVERQTLLGENCKAGTDMYLGEGVVDRYTRQFRPEADFTVRRANLLTRLWKYAPEVAESDSLLYALVRDMMAFADTIHAAGNCYGEGMNKDYTLFCPFATRTADGNITVLDLSIQYDYRTDTSTWFSDAIKTGQKLASNPRSKLVRGLNKPRVDDGYGRDKEDEILAVTYDDGKWTQPYYDCGGGNAWMMSYLVPFFGYENGSYYFKGTSGIDIDLRRVDIDQCPAKKDDHNPELNVFAGSDKCKPTTTYCEHITGLGFRRGSYNCVCKPGYYFPETSSTRKYYNGSEVEEEYEKNLMGLLNTYDNENGFECVRCPEGCDTCIDDRPCLLSLNWLQRSVILILTTIIIGCLIIVLTFLCIYSEVKVIKAASPVLLRIIILGAFLLYSTMIVMYPKPTTVTCTIRIWLRELGFFFGYGALMLKTWRISVVFRVRSAKAIKITDLDLIKRLGLIVFFVIVFLSVRTTVATPHVVSEMSYNDLKAFMCSTDWWDHAFTGLEIIFLMWGICLCVVVRKAPSEFNESRYISMAIYNEFFLSIFLNVSMIFLRSPANPDLLYIIFFCHNQLTTTLLLCLIFGSKAYMVFKGHDNHAERSTAIGSTVAKMVSKNKRSIKYREGNTSSTSGNSYGDGIVHVEEIQEEFCRLYTQLQVLKNKNLRLGNRHLAAKINAMQDVVSVGQWKHCGSMEIPSESLTRRDRKSSHESLKSLKHDVVSNHINDVAEQRNTNSNDYAVVEGNPPEYHTLSASRFSEDQDVLYNSKASISTVSSPSNPSLSKCSSGKQGSLNELNTTKKKQSVNEEIHLANTNYPKARNIVINLDDPELFTEELTV